MHVSLHVALRGVMFRGQQPVGCIGYIREKRFLCSSLCTWQAGSSRFGPQ